MERVESFFSDLQWRRVCLFSLKPKKNLVKIQVRLLWRYFLLGTFVWDLSTAELLKSLFRNQDVHVFKNCSPDAISFLEFKIESSHFSRLKFTPGAQLLSFWEVSLELLRGIFYYSWNLHDLDTYVKTFSQVCRVAFVSFSPRLANGAVANG